MSRPAMKKTTVCWFSGGVSSFVAAYLVRDEAGLPAQCRGE
jgi:tRNA U34 2-thiouridine synthase MnmA/TrmU